MNKSEYTLTKGQSIAWTILSEVVEGKRKQIEWNAFTDEIREKATVKNWMTIRSILQMFLNEHLIKRPAFDPNAPEVYMATEPGDVLDDNFRNVNA